MLGQVGAKLSGVGAKLGEVGAKLGLCWQILAGSWQSQRKVTPHVAENHQRWTQRAQHRLQNMDFGRVLGFMLAPKINKKVMCNQKVRSS